uniref:Uncharacterized protein n=2 Tax=Cucumis melo TaxID=3656 RepID=A0A9I9D990_CUCME
MEQKQIKERSEMNEEDIRKLKDLVLGLSKSVESLAEELRENIVSRRREESGKSEGSVLKMNRKMEEDRGTIEKGTWEQALKWAANCKCKAAEREDSMDMGAGAKMDCGLQGGKNTEEC